MSCLLFEVLTPAAIVLSALAGGTLAVLTIRSQRVTAKKRASLDLLVRVWSDEFTVLEVKFSEFVKQTDPDFSVIVSPTTDEEKHTARSIQRYLNYYEMLCASVIEGVVDEGVLRLVFGDKISTVWNLASPLVDYLRAESNDYEFFECLQKIAVKWQKLQN